MPCSSAARTLLLVSLSVASPSVISTSTRRAPGRAPRPSENSICLHRPQWVLQLGLGGPPGVILGAWGVAGVKREQQGNSGVLVGSSSGSTVGHMWVLEGGSGVQGAQGWF